MTLRTSLALAVAGIALAAASTAQARYPGWYLNEITGEVVTPHAAWAKPYAGGTVKGLFVVPYWYGAREVAELGQRLDLTWDAVTTCDETHLGWDTADREDPYTRQVEGTSPAEKEAQLREYLARPHDVIVLGNFRLASLSPELQYAILEQVKAGTGLVVTFFGGTDLPLFNIPAPEAAQFIFGGVPVAGLPYFTQAAKPEEVLKAATVGRGRVVTLAYPKSWVASYYGGYSLCPLWVDSEASWKDPQGRTKGEEPLQVYYDYYQSLVAKAVLWAAGKEPRAQLKLPVQDGAALSWEQARQPLAVGVAGEVPAQSRVTLTIRDARGQVEQSLTQPCPASGAFASFAVPQLAGGGHFLDTAVVSPAGTVAWASAHFTVKPPAEITEVTAPFTRRTPADTVSGEVKLAGARAGLRLELALQDTYGRVLVQQSRSLNAGEQAVAFSLPLARAVAHWVTVQARLYDGQQLLSTGQTGLPVYGVRKDEYPIVAWATDDRGWLGLLWLQKMRSLGFTGVFQYFFPEQRARADLTMTPFVGGVRYEPAGMGTSPWTDEKWKADREKEITARVTQFFPYGCFLYDLGDENYFRWEQMTYPSDLESLRAFVTRKYGSLEAANAVWGGVIKDGKDLKLITPEEAVQTRQWARWHDQMAHAEYLYAEQHRWLNRTIKTVDPAGQIGPEGSEMGNLEELVRGQEFCGPYNDPYYNTLLRSVSPRDLWRSNWWGGYMWQRNETTLRYQLWQWTFEGNNFLEYYATGGSEGFMAADFRTAYFFDWIARDLQELKRGTGALVAKSEYEPGGVALLHSQASLHLAQLLPAVNSWSRSQDSMIRNLDLQGLQYRYLTTNQLEAGGLQQYGIRALWLGDVLALSERQATLLREFVKAGGVLIADTSPGIASGNCEPLEQGQLDDVFGIAQTGEPQRTAPAKLEAKLATPGGEIVLTQDGVTTDGAVSLAGGKALGKIGEAPAFIANRYGSGLAVLVNCSVYSLSVENQVKLAQYTRALLREAGIAPAACVTDAEGRPIMGLRKNLWRRAGIQTLGVTVSPGSFAGEKDAMLRLAQPAHVYDMERRRYLGQTDSLKLKLTAGGVYRFALLPYEVKQVDLQAPGEVRAGADLALSLAVRSARGAEPGHVVWVQVAGPDGQVRAHYERIVTMDQATARVDVPLALNDAPGTWRVTARDASSGRSAGRTVTVRPAA